ncbi:hypothetical protein L210DRAFT_3509335 [Boletus edulis BED1]|uniref:DUF6830 domain-containing protein n=1 Tax=Boletus edulis BED1 TaxID=1328754 RepID=A0AAD4BF30_BOLED|nr:hypothetical protein L210DRAFT_3509335 [Boletus edulis BED1]
MKTCNKASLHAFLLLVLMPIPQFVHPTTQICSVESVLEAQLFHQCLDIVLEPLKIVACIGKMMLDPAGNLHYYFTSLVSYIVDMPEVAMLACVWGQTSSVTLVKYDQLGNLNTCQTRTGTLTMTQLQSLETDPAAVERYFTECECYCLSGVLGAGELDFYFSVLPPVTSLCHFSHGVTKLKQVTGQTQIAATLVEFHQHKQAILDHGLCHRPQTNAPLEHFNIPKLEMIHNVVPSISNVGSILQWTADTTEHAHIEVVKNPTAMTNNMNYNAQICCTLDCDKKCQLFNIAISLSQQYKHMENGGDADQELDVDADDEINNGMDNDNNLAGELWSESPHHQTTNLFTVAQRLLEASPGTIPRPLRLSISTASPQSAMSLSMMLHRSSIFPTCEKHLGITSTVKRLPQDVPLPFNELRIWYKYTPDQTWKYGHYSGALLNVDEAHTWPSSGLAGHSIVLVRMIMCPTPH